MRRGRRILRTRELVDKFNLEIINEGDLEFRIMTPSIYAVGYELTDFFLKEIEELHTAIQVLGKKEISYLNKLPEDERDRILRKYFELPFQVLIVTEEICEKSALCRYAAEYGKTLLKTTMKPTVLIRELGFYLQQILAPEMLLEGYILLEVFGIGILITGYEEAKIGATIELLERGHKFISDAHIKVKKISEADLIGYNSSGDFGKDKHFKLINRYGADIDITNQFGLRSTRRQKQINMLIDLEPWDEKKFYDRIGLDEAYEEILGVKIQKITLPVRKGRNLAVIIETAAINFRLKLMGINSAHYFWQESQKLIAENKARREKGHDMKDKKVLTVKQFQDEFNLEILNGEGEKLEETLIEMTSVHRPSLALSGYFDIYDEEDSTYRGIQIFSEIEFKFLESMDEEKRSENLKKYLSYEFPLIVLAGVGEIPEYFMEIVKEKGQILLRSPYKKVSQITAKFNAFMESYFAPSTSLHGVFVEMYGFGILLAGKSGVGKSETAFELIHRGHRLIADDMVKFTRNVNREIIGTAARLPYFMEIRGLGIIDIKALYGLGAVRIRKKLDAIIELKDYKSENYLSSISYQSGSEEILGEEIYKAPLYISSGRNAAAMVEIAVMNLMAKRLGYNFEKKYSEGKAGLTLEERRILESDEYDGGER